MGAENGTRIARKIILVRTWAFLGTEIVAAMMLWGLIDLSFTGYFLWVNLANLAHGAAWWMYFKKSRRVNNTYTISFAGATGSRDDASPSSPAELAEQLIALTRDTSEDDQYWQEVRSGFKSIFNAIIWLFIIVIIGISLMTVLILIKQIYNS